MKLKWIEQIEECHGLHDMGFFEYNWKDCDRDIIMQNKEFIEFLECKEDCEEIKKYEDYKFYEWIENNLDIDFIISIFKI